MTTLVTGGAGFIGSPTRTRLSRSIVTTTFTIRPPNVRTWFNAVTTCDSRRARVTSGTTPSSTPYPR